MSEIIEKVVIPSGKGGFVPYASIRIVVEVRDDAGGPYLAIRGENDEPDDDNQLDDEFYLQNIEEIDEFAEICKRLISQYGGDDD